MSNRISRTVTRSFNVFRSEGIGGVGHRVARKLNERTPADLFDFPLRTEDIALPDGERRPLPTHSRPAGSRLTIGWVSTPPGLGSGGHSTMFRMISALERAGHRCELFLYDRYGGDVSEHENRIRVGWPHVRAGVHDVLTGIRNVDACVATSWPTAHVLTHHRPEAAPQFYFIQDFEPLFYPQGLEYELAEQTYSMGFECISLGRMMTDLLAARGIASRSIPFGCDVETYQLRKPQGVRHGVVFFARPGVARRGYGLGVLALREFHRMHPEQTIHTYGARAGDLGFPAIQHGKMQPPDLNRLYNSTIAGLALSFTNVSLVASEMLSAGNIAVVNDSPYSRAALSSSEAEWVAPVPIAVAHALSRIVESPRIQERAERAAASVQGEDWATTGSALVRLIEDRLWKTNQPGPACRSTEI